MRPPTLTRSNLDSIVHNIEGTTVVDRGPPHELAVSVRGYTAKALLKETLHTYNVDFMETNEPPHGSLIILRQGQSDG